MGQKAKVFIAKLNKTNPDFTRFYPKSSRKRGLVFRKTLYINTLQKTLQNKKVGLLKVLLIAFQALPGSTQTAGRHKINRH
jgi:hypothetical protein